MTFLRMPRNSHYKSSFSDKKPDSYPASFSLCGFVTLLTGEGARIYLVLSGSRALALTADPPLTLSDMFYKNYNDILYYKVFFERKKVDFPSPICFLNLKPPREVEAHISWE